MMLAAPRNVSVSKQAGAKHRPNAGHWGGSQSCSGLWGLLSRAGLAVACLAFVPAGNANAVDYPTRSPHIIVGYPAGGTTDILARLFGDWLGKRLGQQFIVENRPARGTISRRKPSSRRRPTGTRCSW